MQKKERVKTECAFCGEIFDLKAYLLKIPTKHGRFCSARCRSVFASKIANQNRVKRVEVNCAYCGIAISLQPYRILEKNFCSNSCRGKYGLMLKWPNGVEVTTVTCAFCGKEKSIPKWEANERVKRGQENFFCNRQCFGGWKSANWAGENNPTWKGGWTEHGTGWNRIRDVVRQEQDYKCLDCGITEKRLGRELDIHHTIPARLFKRKADASIRSNLVGLCHKCHMRREHTEIPLFKM